MCGICGKLVFDGAVGDPLLIARMSQTLIHRGPDDEGIYVAPYIGLGQRRLSIIDLSTLATAPLSNEDRTVWVVLNGEIYNFQALREQLLARGHRFRTGTDTEVIVHLYEEFGTSCLNQMRGMFSFALWDARKRHLFAARDRLGKKPFIYTKTASSFLFGSEIKAITADPAIRVEPDYVAIDAYLTYQYVPSPRTAFAGIMKLPPAHFLICTADGDLSIERYWAPPNGPKTSAVPREIEEELLGLLRESVKLRMISDVPLGAFLSGGVDSGTVVALMAEQSSAPVKTFSIGFEDEAYNELPYARLVAEKYQTDHHEFVVHPDAANVLPTLVKHYNEPFGDSSALPTYYVSKLTRQHVTVALSGDGGDEAFSGYERYGQVAQWERGDAIPHGVRRAIARTASAVLDLFPYHNGTARVARAFAMLGGRLPERYLLQMTILKPQEKRACYTPQFRSLLRQQASADPVAGLPWNEAMDILDWMMLHDRHFYLPDCLMVKTDIASMANSLEVRCPLLDHEFVEFSATIPSVLQRNSAGGKRIFKSAVQSILPAEIVTKRKTGFGVPLAKWFQNELQDALRGSLLDDRAIGRALFDHRMVGRMVDEQVSGRRDWSNRLWALLFLELWFREFID